jgi:hypothetical protein
MKRIIGLLSLAVITLTGFITMGNNTANDSLAPDTPVERLWKDYEAARRADRPQKQLDILKDIQSAALKERLPWDFYRAGEEFVDVSSSRNWKLRDSLYQQFQKDIEAFDEPVLTFYNTRHDLNGKAEFLKKNRSRLEKGHNTGFYEADHYLANEIYSPVLKDLIANDWQYALWSLVLGNRWNTGVTDEFADLLEETLGGKYPDATLLEFTHTRKPGDDFRTKEYMEEYARKYDGKAVALMARQTLLSIEFEALERDDKGTSEQYRALREKCTAFEKARKAFSGSEKKIADCCNSIENLIEQLDDQFVSFTVEDGLLKASLRNLGGITVTVKDSDGKNKVWSTRLDNPARSYYALDTVKVQLPAFDDGVYNIECSEGKTSSEQQYRRYGLSAAQKEDARGYAVYVARAKSGEPVRKVDITLKDNKDKVLAELKDFALGEGFTYLPKDFTDKFLERRYNNRLEFSMRDTDGTLRKTQESSPATSNNTQRILDEQTYAAIFVDRSVFNPGETARFKVVRYYGDRRESLRTQADRNLTVKLFDAQGKEVSSKELKTNEFGSAAGEFFLERRERGGMFRIAVYDGNRHLSSASIRVDDVVLPTFDLTFDSDPNLYFPGDSIEVSGTLKSYSGHSLAAADIRYSVTESGRVVSEGVLRPDRNGRFKIDFKSGQGQYLYYNVHVGVSDATGETLEWNTGRQVQRSIPFSATLENHADAEVSMLENHVWRENENYSYGVVSDDIIRLSLHTETYRQNINQSRKSLRINYTLKSGGKTIAEGKASPGDVLELNTAGSPSGLYVFEAVAADKDVYGNDVKSTVVFDILKVKEGDTALNADVKNLFMASEKDGGITVQIGATNGPVWAVVELFGSGNVVLGSKTVYLKGVKGQEGSLESVHFDWPSGAPDVVRVNVLYFKDYSQFSFSRQFDRSAKRLELPLAFTRFLDKTAPGTSYSFEIATKPGVECVATIFDKSSERIQANRWSRIYMSGPEGPSVYFQTIVGTDRTDYRIMVRGVGGGRLMSKSASNASFDMVEMAAAPAPMAEMAIEEEALELNETVVVGYGASMNDAVEMDEDMGADISVREDFAKTVAFEPFLRSDAEGKISLDFTTADKLSTFVVQLFAHDKSMDNAVLRQEMTVTVPAKVSLVEPLYLYEGDRYFVKASLSSSVDEALTGRLRIDLYDGKDYKNTAPIRSTVKQVTLEPMGALSEDLEIEVPEGVSELGIKLTFIADGDYGSDAVFVGVPVYKAVQTLTEAHSSILHSGESMESLLAQLKSEFVNVSEEDAEMKVISMLDMVKEAIPSKVEPASENVLDLSEALYVRLLAAKLGVQQETRKSDSEILAALLACRNDDGGFAWFKDMDSSPIITAVLLDRYAGLRRRGIDVSAVSGEVIESAVKYLDKVFFGDSKRPIWCGGLSEEQYVSVRVQYPEVEFSTKGVDSKQLRDFRKRMKEYLTPRKERGLNGYVLGKARRMRALMSLAGSDEGRQLASAWGIRLGTTAKLRNSLKKDLSSLLEYAIGHKSGGWYYPNAVMPFRGLLESEAYAHAYIADLLRDCAAFFGANEDTSEARSIADGISLWLMVQKETQKWDEDAAFVDAISSVLDAPQEVLDTRVVTLTKTFTKPFVEVEAYGNGFTVERRFFVERTVDGKVSRKEISDGELLAIGDKVFAEYRIWNEENRSFVKLTAPRPANLRPANQLSGHYGWWLRPLSVAGWHTFTPHGYRSVLSDRTEYWFDSYPEENTTVTEEFLVTQAGSFQTPAVSIESLYAPHYRAADRGRGPLLSE